MKPWENLPGVEKRALHHFHWQPGIISIFGGEGPGGDAAENIARGFRLGVSPVLAYRASHIWTDQMVAATNRAAGRSLCKECGGTGNWLASMYQACKVCDGKGYIE